MRLRPALALPNLGVTSLLLAARYTQPNRALRGSPLPAIGGTRMRYRRSRLWILGQAEKLGFERVER